MSIMQYRYKMYPIQGFEIAVPKSQIIGIYQAGVISNFLYWAAYER
jgi:hypothetical protein